MKRHLLSIGLTLVMLAAAILPAGAQSPSYPATPIGAFDGASSSDATAVSAAGHVVVNQQAITGFPRAYLWQANKPVIDLGTLGGNGTQAADVNVQGTVVGGSDTVEGYSHAFIWDANNGMVDLGKPGVNSGATAINDSGVVVGWSELDGRQEAVRWIAGGMQYLQMTGVAAAINAGGMVIGHSSNENFDETSFFWTETGTGDIKHPNTGAPGVFASALNDEGVVIGGVNGQAFRWTLEMGMQFLFPGEFSGASAINSSGLITGTVMVSGVPNAFRYHPAMGASMGPKVEAYPTAITESGVVFGFTASKNNPVQAFVWDGGPELVSLNPMGAGDSIVRRVRGGYAVGTSTPSGTGQPVATVWTFEVVEPPPPPVEVIVTITAPEIVAAFQLSGAPIYFEVVASSGTPSCTLQGKPFKSGDLMPIGAQMIDCSSTDPSGSIGNAAAVVHVVLSGSPGANGAKGDTGAAGADGAVGPIGPAGATGATGAAGADGAQGPKGDKGDTGDQGANGANGAKGDTGAAGADGAVGPIGPAGATGATGAVGADGVDGAKGETGAAGADGAVGPQGPVGETGPAGPAGPQGNRGDTGEQGATGANGANGANGADGADGAKGDTGAAGPQGLPGLSGADGSKGETGAAGPQGAVGPVGPQGAIGPQGPAGTNGANGAPGLVQVPGSILLMMEGVAPPAGYAVVGTFVEERIDADGKGGKRPARMRIVMWRKL